MHLYIPPEYLDTDDPSIIDIYEFMMSANDCWKIWRGGWEFLVNAHWYSKQPSPNTTTPAEHDSNTGWFFHSRVMLSSPLGQPNGITFEPLLSDALEQFKNKLLHGDYKSYKNSPEKLTREQRLKLTELANTIQSKEPELPKWAHPFPVCVYGDPQNWFSRVGEVFCPLGEDFAVDIFISAYTGGHTPAKQELHQVKHLLRQKMLTRK